MKSLRPIALMMVLLLYLMVIVTGCEDKKSDGPAVCETGRVPRQQAAEWAVLEFDIRQDMELISLATFSEPPQFAIWLEDPQTGKLKTIFATYRSATGDMIGKAECPGCLPLWFAVWEKETGKDGFPTMDEPAPAAVTCPTPLQEHFTLRRRVEYGSRFILWMEMNLAGDFNKHYREDDEEAGIIDWDYSGQPCLVYRCEITAVPGNRYVPELFGQVDMEKPFNQMIVPVSDDVTTAKGVFKSIEIRVVHAEPNSPG